MKTTCTLLALSLSLFIWPATAQARGQCTTRTIAGTYAFAFTGASTIVTGVAPDTFHWTALFGPIAGTGVMTIEPDGTVGGHYWLVAGAWNLGLTAIPLVGVAVVDPDCTGWLEFGFGSSVLRERLVVLDNGRELRSVVTETAVPTGNWLTKATRIAGSCGQHKVRGDYLFECKSLFSLPVPAPNIFGGAIHIRVALAAGGDYTGTVYGKVGPDNSGFPVSGQILVHEDCTAEGTLLSPLGVGLARGVFFDEGRRGYWLPLAGVLPDGTEVPQPYGYCEITKIGNR